MASKPQFRMSAIKNDRLLDPIKEFTNKTVFIGITDTKTGRSPGPGRSGPQPTNALLMAIHENGSPAKNIPARPVLVPAIDELRKLIGPILYQTARAEMRGQRGSVEKGLRRIGEMGVAIAKRIMKDGDFEPLAAITIKNRARRRARASEDDTPVHLSARTRSQTASVADDAPLMDTMQLYDALSYSIRKQ